MKSSELNRVGEHKWFFCVFNEHFGQVGSLLAQYFYDDGNPLQLLDTIGTIDDSNFVEVPVDFVKTCIEKTKSSSAGFDNISMSVFEYRFDINRHVVTEICNRSFSSGIFSNGLKIAKIKCIFSKGSWCDVNNTGLHFLNFFKSQEEELIILVAFFLLITNIKTIFSLHVQISRDFMLNL